MKKLALLILSVLCFISSKSQLLEDFGDGNFTSNPVWIGVDSLWKVVGGELNSDCHTINFEYSLTTANTRHRATEWHWRCNLKFATSSANYVDFYLTSDVSDLSASPQGYFVRVGNTKDDISLYKTIAGVETLLIDGIDAFVPSNSDFNIKVIEEQGMWKLYAQDLKNNSSFYSLLDSAVDSSLNSSAYFGVKIKQSTASFFEKHFFDDFYIGDIIRDTTAPMITSVQVLSPKSLDVTFDEALDSASIYTAVFGTQNTGTADSVISVDGRVDRLRLEFSKEFADGLNTLFYSGVKDYAGNIRNGGQVDFSFQKIEQYSVLISEVLADFNPSFGLPDAKYIELYNNSSEDIQLQDWKLIEKDKVMTLPNFVLSAHSYVIVTSSATQATKFSSYGDVIYASYFPSLSLNGSEVLLVSAEDKVIHSMRYDLDSYSDDFKSQGGYSLELRDPTIACYDYDGYSASNDLSGGTPGAPNSLDLDGFVDSELKIKYLKVLTPQSVQVKFNKSWDLDALDLIQIRIDNQICNVRSDSVFVAHSLLTIDLPLTLEEGQLYTLDIEGVKSCSESQNSLSMEFGRTSDLAVGDLLITEVLYDAYSGYSDWIEVYNNSKKIFDANSIVLGFRDEFGNFDDVNQVQSSIQILPGKYYVFSQDDATKLASSYRVPNPNQLIELDFSYSLNSDEDHIVVLSTIGTVIDELKYSDDWQYELLNSSDGVSLERVSLQQRTQDKNNWHSASSDVGFATPTYRNSSLDNSVKDDQIEITQSIISPDGDGKDDYILINYKVTSPDYFLNASVFDLGGSLKTEIAKNITISTEGHVKWDAILENGERMPSGQYILWVELHTNRGDQIIKKFPITIVMP